MPPRPFIPHCPRILDVHLLPTTSHASSCSHRKASYLSSSPPEFSPPRRSDGEFGHRRDETFDSFLRWVASGALVAGSTLAYLGWTSSRTTAPSPPSPSPLAGALLAHADSQQETHQPPPEDSRPGRKPRYIFGDAYRRKVFFNYEKRIRMQSPPEKVFEYFASLRTAEGEILMTPADLMRAAVPVFPPSDSSRVREGNLRGERGAGHLHCAPSEFFMLFDTNNDGFISFAEYIFFVTLLSIPETSFSVAFKMFDLDNNGVIDRGEFKKVMALMRAQNPQGARHRDGRRVWRRAGESVENGGLVEYFFGKDGKGYLRHGKFVQFLRDLHSELLQLEFAHYDFKQQGTISARDFALSLVASADIGHIPKFLNRVEEMSGDPSLCNIRITFEEFKSFADVRKQLQPLSIAIFSYGKAHGLLTKKDFQRAAAQICGVSLTGNVVDIVFHVFDANRDGDLSCDEFVKVLQRRERDVTQTREAGFAGLIACWLSCATACSSARNLL